MTDRLSQVEKSLPIMLLRAREAVMKRFRPMLKAQGLTEQQWRVLRVLQENGPMELTKLALESVVLTPSLTRILARLASRGLISRAPDRNDKRRQHAQLTEQGRALIAQISPESARIYAEIEEEFGRDDLHQLMQALRRLASNPPH